VPVRAVELDDGNPIGSVSIDATGTIVFFSATRAGGRGGQDIYTATRPTRDAPFGAPVALDELNSNLDDQDPSISADLHVLAFSRGGDVDRELYIATR
jgi:hypothetical protein